MSRTELNKDTFDKFQGDSIVTDASFRGVGESFQGCIDLAERMFGPKANIILLPGTYDGDVTVTTCKIHAAVPNSITFNGTITGGYIDNEGNGYYISGNTLTVTSVGQPGDMYTNDPQEPYDDLAVDDLLGEPSVTNPVWLSFQGVNFEQSRTSVTSVTDVDGTDSTITTSAAHGFEAGDYVRLVGMTVSAYDSEQAEAYEVKTAPTDTTFTIEMTYSETATGIAIKQGVLVTSNDYVGVEADNKTVNLVVK